MLSMSNNQHYVTQVPGIDLSGDSSWEELQEFNAKKDKQLIHRVVYLLLHRSGKNTAKRILFSSSVNCNRRLEKRKCH